MISQVGLVGKQQIGGAPPENECDVRLSSPLVSMLPMSEVLAVGWEKYHCH